MVQTPTLKPALTWLPFADVLPQPLQKQRITVLQINLGRRCNLACTHCHVEAGPQRTEELSPEICEQLITVIEQFPQIETVDLTGGAPEMNYGFRPLVEAARRAGKRVLVRSNLTIFFAPGFEDLPDYFAAQQVRVVASLPCYLEKNVDRQRGAGVYQGAIAALQALNQRGYGRDPRLGLDLVYNPSLPQRGNFQLPPPQENLAADYHTYLREHFGIEFNDLYTITNIPIGRTQQYLERQGIAADYQAFLAANHNGETVNHLMCRNQLSVDYEGKIYDCDFNQMAGVEAVSPQGKPLTIGELLARKSLDLISEIQTADYCYGCTAGCGSSCGGALV